MAELLSYAARNLIAKHTLTGYIYSVEQLTLKQRRVYDYIRQTLARRQSPPTRAEIARALGFASANAAQAHLRTLERKGMIALDARQSRGIRVLDTVGTRPPKFACAPEIAAHMTAEHIELAVIGRVAAGAPLLAVANVERRVQVDATVFSAQPDYMLRVRGESMKDAGIFENDLLAVKRSPDVRAGQIAVFRIDEEVTVKRFQRDGTRVRLIAENPAFADIVIDTEREPIDLEGIAVGVIRAL